MSDPKRLIVSEDNELGVALAVARRQVPSSNRLAELAERLVQNGAPLPPVSIAPALPPAPRPSGFRLGLKLKLGIGIVVFGALGGLGLWGRARVATAPKMQREPSTAIATRDQVVPPQVNPTEASPKQADTVARRLAARTETKVGAGGPLPEPESVAPIVPPTSTEPAVPSPPSAVPSARRPARSVGKVNSPQDAYERPSGEELPQTELELLKQARNAITADPLRAYALTERSRALFPQAALAQEREFIAITALYRMGRTQQARSQALVFRSHYPRSAYLPQIARMLEDE